MNPWFLYWIIRNKLTKTCEGFTPRIIHSNVIHPCGTVGYLLAKKFKAKHVISEHWSKVEKHLKNPLYRKLSLNAYRNSDAVLCVSNFLAAKLKTLIQLENIQIVPNVIDSKLFRYVPKIQEGYPCLRFFCIAIWDLPKRLDLIMNSLATFTRKTDKKIILNVVGNGSQKEDFLNMKVPENLIVNWLGYKEKSEILNILSKTDFFLHASNIETFSIVTVEALSSGTPVLASNAGALPEFINASNGILVENTIEAWVKGLEEITSQTYNNQKIANEISGKFSPEIVGKTISQIYDNIDKP